MPPCSTGRSPGRSPSSSTRPTPNPPTCNSGSVINTGSPALLQGTILAINDAGVLASGTYDIFQNANDDGQTPGEYFMTASGQALTNGTVFNDGQNTFTISYDIDSTGLNPGSDIVLTTTAVPEPASLALAGLGAGGLLLRRRRKAHRR